MPHRQLGPQNALADLGDHDPEIAGQMAVPEAVQEGDVAIGPQAHRLRIVACA